MIDEPPDGIPTEDWHHTPETVRHLIAKIKRQQEVDKAHSLYLQQKLHQTTVVNLPEYVTYPEPPPSVEHHLLVVDDNEMNRDMLSRRLRRQGHKVSMANNGREALQMLADQDFDLVLLDIMMPELNGYEALQKIKADSTTAHIPVIMITAVDELESVVKCIQLGAEDYLPKPFNPVFLKARVEASLEKKRLRDQQAAYTRRLDLENQRKSKELAQARQIQLSMLPAKPPSYPHLDIAARQDTATEVGGDYYDFFEGSEGQVRVAIGDATGHGVASGLMVSMTKASLLGANEADLNALLKKINSTLVDINLGSHLNMALMLMEIFPPASGGQQPARLKLRASGGGMPPIYILRATGGIEEILVPGLPLGVLDEARYRDFDFEVHTGDVLLLTSDGLPERFNANHEFLGFDRLIVALEQIDVNDATAAEVLDQIASISDEWGQDYPPHDDMTLVVVKIK
ncbi:MAG: response regulator [Anaerolineae bacterium]|nr:response regulator [Anaerolineae bacterium]